MVNERSPSRPNPVGYIFDDRSGEVATRWAYDREASRMLAVQFRKDGRWRDGDAATLADVEDSVVNANGECLENPAEWDLDAVDELPDWAPEPAAGPAP